MTETPGPSISASTNPVPALQADGVSKRFAGVHALTGVSFSVEAGSIHALVGENGAGKSTLIKVLTGVHQPDDGQLLYQGRPVSFTRPADAQNAGISTVYQEINLVPLLSVARNIYLGREPRTRLGLINVRTMNRDAAKLIREFGIRLDVTAELGTFGLGIQQMIALARAVTIEAKVVIMDEPTSSLEIKEVETLFAVARRLRDQGAGIVFVSHRLDELWQLCDAVTILRDGRLVHTGAMADLDRRALISHMLGRDIADVAAHGAPNFEESSSLSSQAPVLSVSGLQSSGRLHDIGFQVRPGEVLGLAGLLGSGRSETVKAVYGALGTSAGELQVGGKKLRRNSITSALDAGVALLSEDRMAEGIIPELSVRDNIVLAVMNRVSRAGIISDAKVNDLVDTFIKRLHIKVSSPRQLVSQLSGGNQQKVLIARWLCTEPRVFLLDEPTRGIDVGAKREVQELIDELAGKGLGVVLISSESDELVEGSDRILVLHEGSISEEISGSELTNARLLSALVGTDRPKEGSVQLAEEAKA